MNKDQISVYKSRRDNLRARLKAHGATDGLVVLFADVETERHAFRQENSFYYLTGVKEPGAVLMLNLKGQDILYLPTFEIDRTQWLTSALTPDAHSASCIGVDEIKPLGRPARGYSLDPFFAQETYAHVLNEIKAYPGPLFMLAQPRGQYTTQISRLRDLATHIPGMQDRMQDLSPVLHDMRRTKEVHELEALQHAVDITIEGQGAAAMTIAPQAPEQEVHATIEYVFTCAGAQIAFPSIVAAGKNSCVLHYTDRNKIIKEGDLVVVDIGAEWHGYAADITRTYPASGRFTPRQKEIYELVLATQTLVAAHAKPGMYLKNNEQPEKSLHHIALNFLKEQGYDKYFVHGIGHYLGLDVHDVGDYTTPLRPGDVFTIEPGVYLNNEQLGVRIEDDYVITKDGCVCLSEALPKSPEAIEEMMKKE